MIEIILLSLFANVLLLSFLICTHYENKQDKKDFLRLKEEGYELKRKIAFLELRQEKELRDVEHKFNMLTRDLKFNHSISVKYLSERIERYENFLKKGV